jgi:hypothetical protein
MPEAALQLVVYATSGALLVVPLVRFLGRNWFEEQKAFRVNTIAALEKLTSRIAELETHTDRQTAAALRTCEALVQALRDEGAAAREVLRQHVDREDLIIRERNHQLAGKMGALRNRVAVIREGQNRLVTGVEALTKTVHELEVTVAEKLTAKENL